MSKIHQYDEKRAPDTDFMPGELGLLCPGNECRLLDPRRTPGVIEEYLPKSAIFRWRITAFEHKGRSWDVPAEDVTRYQFARGSRRLDQDEVDAMETAIRKYQSPFVIAPDPEARRQTEAALAEAESMAGDWLRRESVFVEQGAKLDFGARTGPPSLATDCANYLKSLGMGDVERRTAENVVLNPNSGEWVKGMEIVLAEMGLAGYKGKVPRTSDIFEGAGSKAKRAAYLTGRIAFVRAYFKFGGVEEVVLYRGLSFETPRLKPSGALTSYTFSLRVARSFCDFDRDGSSTESLLVKRTIPVTKLLMTYLETSAMNRDYKEAEALVLSG